MVWDVCAFLLLADVKEVESLIHTALEQDVNFFDHADIYGGGEAEELFGKAMDHSLREKMIIQSKCAIRPGVAYDFSKEYILKSVDGILKRLNTEYLDMLLLHRAGYIDGTGRGCKSF